MGRRMKSGGRWSQASEHPPAVIPRCGPASPFKGHLSTKSNAFCIDSSRSLTNQYLIRDHMMCHYNRMLSAKAAVDCSVPKSRLTSIKCVLRVRKLPFQMARLCATHFSSSSSYSDFCLTVPLSRSQSELADQQRREKLKKKIARCEEKMSVCETVSRSSSRGSGRLPSSFGKTFLEEEDKDGLFPCAGQAQDLSRALSPYGEHDLVHTSTVKYGTKCSRHTSRASHSSSSIATSRPPRNHSGLSCSRSADSFVSTSHSQRCQRSSPKVCSGDLLERHSEYFTKSRKPFTPRTLISDAKSFLSQYRYYTPARRKKKKPRKPLVEVQTQTDVIRFSCTDKVSGEKVMTEQQKITLKAEDRRYTVDEPDRGIDACPCAILRETSLNSQKSSPRKTIEAQEEELLYLTFIEDVTNEILSLGLFSKRVLEQLFECHIEENKHRLDEAKMRHMLDVLKTDLGYGPDSEAEQMPEGLDSLDLQEQEFDTVEEVEFTTKGHRVRKATKSEEFFETMDLSLEEPNKCESPLCRAMSKETQSMEDFSEDMAEIMDAGTESDYCVKSEEHTHTSPTCEATLNLIACDSDLEVRKELDDLEESFAEALQISDDYL